MSDCLQRKLWPNNDPLTSSDHKEVPLRSFCDLLTWKLFNCKHFSLKTCQEVKRPCFPGSIGPNQPGMVLQHKTVAQNSEATSSNSQDSVLKKNMFLLRTRRAGGRGFAPARAGRWQPLWSHNPRFGITVRPVRPERIYWAWKTHIGVDQEDGGTRVRVKSDWMIEECSLEFWIDKHNEQHQTSAPLNRIKTLIYIYIWVYI